MLLIGYPGLVRIEGGQEGFGWAGQDKSIEEGEAGRSGNGVIASGLEGDDSVLQKENLVKTVFVVDAFDSPAARPVNTEIVEFFMERFDTGLECIVFMGRDARPVTGWVDRFA